MKINMNHWSQEIIEAKDRRNLPILYFPCLKNIGMGVAESVQDPVKMAKGMEEVIREYPETIAAITGMDLTVDTEAFGGKVHFSELQAPNIEAPVVKTREEIEALPVPDIHSGRVDMFTRAATEAANRITDRPVFGGMLGPFSLAASLMEVTAAMMMIVKDKSAVTLLIEKSTEFLIARAKEYKAAGANGVFIAEPTAGLLSPKQCDELSSLYVKKIVDAVQDDFFFVILHNCGRVKKSVASMYGTGCKGYHFGNSVDMKDILPQIPPDVLVFGNIDPSSDFFLSTPGEIKEKTSALLRDMEPYPHFVLSSGCDLAPTVKKENIDAYYEACREYNASNGLSTVIRL
ncbi:MAG: uroporphyrinogen decarboxylase family protein [Ruminococcus sp.]|jgi:uroporphyrinogen decarboxylase